MAATFIVVSVIVVLSLGASASRLDRRTEYEAEYRAQRGVASTIGLSTSDDPSQPPGDQVCIEGVDTFARGALRAIRAGKLPTGMTEPVKLLRCVSLAAISAHRWVEQATAAPALPQRMGLRPGENGRTVVSRVGKTACKGSAYAEFQLDRALFRCP